MRRAKALAVVLIMVIVGLFSINARGSQPVTASPEVYKSRLESIQKAVPLVYNQYVQKYIELYAASNKRMARMVGLAKYYFPLFDQGFKRYNVPDEIKYLSIVESALDPTIVSRTGAVGQWQFMPVTAFEYGLKIDDYVDERRDPVAASSAAANYLRMSYSVFGDWLLAIASYNCGKPAVTRAIQKAGNVYDFWAIRQYLPTETQNYVPAFIATVYMMNFYSKHNIVPLNAGLSLKNDVLQVEKFVSLTSIAKAAQIGVQQISSLNPLYKGDIVNGSAMAPKTLILPSLAATAFKAVYEVLNGGERTASSIAQQPSSETLAYLDERIK